MHLVPGYLAAERVRQMAVSNHDLHVAEQRLDAYAAISFPRSPDFACVGALVICNYLAVAEADEPVDEIVGLIGRGVDPLVGDRFKGSGFWRSEGAQTLP